MLSLKSIATFIFKWHPSDIDTRAPNVVGCFAVIEDCYDQWKKPEKIKMMYTWENGKGTGN